MVCLFLVFEAPFECIVKLRPHHLQWSEEEETRLQQLQDEQDIYIQEGHVSCIRILSGHGESYSARTGATPPDDFGRFLGDSSDALEQSALIRLRLSFFGSIELLIGD